MTFDEIIKAFNNKEQTKKEVAEVYGKNLSTLYRDLNKNGYFHNKETGKWEFTGEKAPQKHNASIDESTAKASESNIKVKASNSTSKSEQKASESKHDESKSELDTIDMLLNMKATAKKRTYRGFYFDDDVLSVIDNVATGNKSDLVNEILRKTFKDKGLLG